jgi:NAD(P)-dependent dehydrogenase (short-subunit alcohol dehydrogenase family)
VSDETHQGKVAVITGGGRGFGKAFGTALAARGAHVVLADIDGAAAAAAAAEIAGKGGSASGAVCDVADEASVAAVFGEVAERHGGIDILVNNAGLHSAAYNKPSAEIGVAGLRRLFDVNVMGVYICSLAARPVDEVARVMAQQILPREGEEQDIVDAFLFLVSPAASFVTGETLRVTGGFALSV